MNHFAVEHVKAPFSHLLNVTLKLDVDGTEGTIHSSQIVDLVLNLQSYGFDGSIEFHTVKDSEFHDLITKKGPMKFELSFKSTEKEDDNSDPLVEIKGFITKKSAKKFDVEKGKKDEEKRMYLLEFTDAAQAIWSRHHPVNIYVDETMKSVIDQHKNADITIDYNLPDLEKEYPILAFKLTRDKNKDFDSQSNFYSFINWYLHQQNGILRYDYKKNEYHIEEKKEDEGDEFEIYDRWVHPPKHLFPQIDRANVKVHTHDADKNNPKDEEVDEPFTEILEEYLDYESYQLYPELAKEKIESSTYSADYELEVEVNRFFHELHLDKLMPGQIVSFKPSEEVEEAWSHDADYKDKKFRSKKVAFRAYQYSEPNKVEDERSLFQIQLLISLEQQEEKHVERPSFVSPQFPFSIHGKVFSDIGEEEQSTYKLGESEQFPKGHYLVEVPLVGNDKKLKVAFFPDFMTGQYYFPLCKNERVLLEVYFRAAKIQKTIDWQPLARMPMGIQGNQIVFSSNGKDKYMILTHEFEGGSDSVFTIKQSSSDSQTQTIRIKEKEIEMIVEEKDKKIITTKLNSDTGLLLSLEDKSSDITQQTSFDGKVMTHVCKGSKTSTIQQKPESIAIDCEEFSVNSEKIKMTAKDSISQSGKSQVNIETNVANVSAPTVKLGN